MEFYTHLLTETRPWKLIIAAKYGRGVAVRGRAVHFNMAFSGLKLETPKPLNVVTKQNVKTTTNQVRHLSQPQHPSQNHSNEAGTEKQPAPLQSSCANLTHSMGSLVTKI